MMKVRCISDDRSIIKHVLEKELKKEAVYRPLPEFAWSVGGCILTRDGFVEINHECDMERIINALEVLGSLGLCDYPYEPEPPGERDIAYSMHRVTGCTDAGYGGQVLLNIMSMISARQFLINRAIDARDAFRVERGLMADLLAHPPLTVSEFLQRLYGRDKEYRGMRFTGDRVVFTGFRKSHREEASAHRQLADLLIAAAGRKQWAKSFTHRVRNPKYAFRIWLNSIGMIGPEYEETRRILLSRLPGRGDHRRLEGRSEV